MSKIDLKVYRLALLGATSSGKTAFLSALAMQRIAEPSGSDVSWLPIDIKLPDDEKHQQKQLRQYTTKERKHITSLLNGQKWLNEAISHLEKGEVPPATPPDTKDMVFEFKVTHLSKTYSVEIIDYAGELINPKLAPGDNAKYLKKKLESTDGLIILAPMPGKKDNNGLIRTELNDLQSTFSALKHSHLSGANNLLPVALVLNKWDHYSSEKNYDQKAGINYLIQHKEEPHRKLYEATKNIVTSKNIDVFPVSAFGKCERIIIPGTNREIERPINIKPLYTYGLVPPLTWLLERCDALDVDRFSNEIVTLKRTNWIHAYELLKKGQLLLLRFKPNSEHYNKVIKYSKKAKKTFKTGFYVTLIILISFSFLFYQQYKGSIIKSEKREWVRLSNSKSDLDTQIQQFENFIKMYPGGKYIGDASNQLTVLMNKSNWDKFLIKFNAYIKNKNCDSAANVLAKQTESNNAITEIKDEFNTRCMDVLKQNVQLHIGNRTWNKAYELINEANAWNPSIVNTNAKKKITDIEHKVKLQHDEYLYNLLKRKPTKKNADKYLTNAKLVA